MGYYCETFKDETVNIRGALLENEVGLTDGQWMAVGAYDKMSLHLVITGGAATVKICGSDEPAPGNNTHGYQIFADKAASEIMALKTPIRWIKARVTANTGSVSLYFNGV